MQDGRLAIAQYEIRKMTIFGGISGNPKPAAVEDYDIHKLTAAIVGLVDAFGEKTSILIGHDWGARHRLE